MKTVSRPWSHRARHTPIAVIACFCTLSLAGFVGSASAVAGKPSAGPKVAPPPAVPVTANQIQNIDQVRTAIKGYYGDTVSGTNPDGTPQHLASPTGNYAKEVKRLEVYIKSYLDYTSYNSRHAKIKPAVVFDIDDTTLNTYNYEIDSNFAYNPATNATFVNAAAFPAVFGMPGVVQRAVKDGYAVFFISGRPQSQQPVSVENLKKVGYPSAKKGNVFVKNPAAPWLSSCTTTCTTSQFKTLTRAHIQSLGYKIVANVGDQYSDLVGGHAKKTFKVPNPMYYLP